VWQSVTMPAQSQDSRSTSPLHAITASRWLTVSRNDITERKMFGGLAFLCLGRMCCGIVVSDLMVRIPDDELDAVMRGRHVRPMDFTGKPLRGFVYVSPLA